MMYLMEAMFDIAYLGLVIGLGLRLLLERSKDAKKYGLTALILGLGDAFHLIPRVVSNLSFNGFEKYVAFLSWGEFVTSITMTLFYILFYQYYRTISKDNNRTKALLIYGLAIVRTALVLLPQNLWGTKGDYLFGVLRNIPFAVMGYLLIIWSWEHREKEGLKGASVLIAASFIFYLPVVLGARFVSILGLFMIPKTVAYVLLVVLGYRHFIKDFRAENLLKSSVVFLVLGLFGGVFYREFVKLFDWECYTALSVVHVHTLVLGFLAFACLYALMQNEGESLARLKTPFIIYVTGLAWTVVSFFVRGIYDITAEGVKLFSDAALSGLAGLGHILLGIGMVLIMLRVLKIKTSKSEAAA